MEKLFEGSYAHSVGAVGKAYDDFFIKRSSMRVPEEIPPSLSYLFHLMSARTPTSPMERENCSWQSSCLGWSRVVSEAQHNTL